MSINELEELVSTIRQYIQGARNRNDAFEYCRLCDELKFAEAALADADCEHQYDPRPQPVNPANRSYLALI